MIEKLIEIKEYNGRGYQPMVAFERWRVALLNYDQIFEKENIPHMEKHLLTDEVFVLLNGEAILYIADGDDQPEGYQCIPMEPNKLYNIRQGVWHNIEVAPGSQILIVENDDVSRENSRYYPISSDVLP